MRFTSAASVLALVGAVLAQTDGFDPIEKPSKGETIPAGSKYEIVWQTSDKYPGTVTITLLGGSAPKNLTDIEVIAKSIDNAAGSFDWAVAEDLGAENTYGLRIGYDADKDVFQYSFPFVIKGGDGSSKPTGTSTGSEPTGTSGSGNSSATVSTYKTSHTSASVTKPVSNHTTTYRGPTGGMSTDVTVTTTPSSTASGTPSAIPSNPAGTVAASSLALVGGLAMAIFAL